MSSFVVRGGQRLQGEIVPQGAKNEALQILCAVLLTAEPVTISNIPTIRDVNKLIELLRDMGVRVEQLAADTYRFQADAVRLDYLDTPEFTAQGRALRGSVMILGPMLTRFGRCQLPKPGGDKIGRRPLDTHFLGLEKLGGKLTLEGSDFYRISAEGGLRGTHMLLDEASVTGTANIVMAAVLAEGVTTIYNAACEPYLQQLCRMLVRMGASIQGIGSNLLTIEGVRELGGTEHRMLPDMIEIGSFIGLAAMTGSEITIKDCQIPELGLIPDTFRKLGIRLEFRGDDIYIPAQEHYEISTYLDGSILTVSDHTWPGFTPDLLINASCFAAVPTLSNGTVLTGYTPQQGPGNGTYVIGNNGVTADTSGGTLFGSAGRNTLQGPFGQRLDLSATRTFRLPFLGEEGNVTFRAEAFKIMNNPIFSNPNANISNSNFGQITSTLDSTGRILQLALKLNF